MRGEGVPGLGVAEARRLGHHWIGEEHVLVALARSDCPAGHALRGLGATPERLEQVIVDGIERADVAFEPVEVDSPSYTPAMYRAFGRVEGLALARGADSVTREDVLVALLWPAGYAASIVHHLGTERSALPARLAAAGVPVPPVEPEPLGLRPRRRVDVPSDRLMEIVRELSARLPADGCLGFNHDGKGRAWVVIGDEPESEAVVADVLDRTR